MSWSLIVALIKRIPWQAWAVLAALVVLWGIHHHGVISGRAQVQAKFDTYLNADRAAEAIAKQRKDLKERADREAFAKAAADYEKGKADAVAKERAVADGLRRGALRLRQGWNCPAADLPGSAASAEAADAGAELRAASAGRIVRVGAEADAQVKGLQALLRAERERPIQP